ncbi:MAG: BIG2 domain-containing protein [Lachnoclostridium sp.]|jgi:hypothetical protein
MKKKTYKVLSFVLIFLLLLPMISLQSTKVSAKPKPSYQYKQPALSVTEKILTGKNKTFELSVKNLNTYDKSIQWYSLNEKVVTVKASGNGKSATVTSVGPGSTDVRCKIKLSYGFTVNLYCKVTVVAVAESIQITNARNDWNLRHVMKVGERYTFKAKIMPENAMEKVYWFVDNKNYATVNSKGMVTAKKAGTVTLTAVAAKNEREAATSSIRNQVLIEIVNYNDGYWNVKYEPQAKLLSLVRTDKYRLTATFDRAIQTPGLVLVNNKTECIEGKVDSSDSKKVNFTLSNTSAGLTGWKEVYIGYWEGYQVAPSDTSSDKFIKMNVDFTISTVNPVNPLPAPVSVTQSQSDNNVVLIQFNNRLDKTTAEKKANYSISGVKIQSAELTNDSYGKVVKLTLNTGSIPADGNYSIVISGIKGYENTYTVMNPYYGSVYLKENSPPVVTNVSYIYPGTIEISFNEPLQGTPSFQVLQNNKEYASYSYVDYDKIYIILKSTPEMNKSLKIISTKDNDIADLSGNKLSSLTRNIVPSK